MAWLTYYNLLHKYNGRLDLATKDERDRARAENHANPSAALQVANEKFMEERQKLAAAYSGIKNRTV